MSAYILNELQDTYPHGIVSEEADEIGSTTTYKWYIDPLDGTRQFTFQIPLFCVSIALAEQDIPVLGVVYNPYTDDMFYADESSSYFSNERLGMRRQNKVRGLQNLSEATVGINGPQTKDIEIASAIAKAFSPPYVKRKVVFRGPSALELSYVGSGSSDGFAAHYQEPWDIAAGMLIAEKAGAVALGFDGTKATVNTRRVIVTNPHLTEQMLRRLESVDL